MSNLIFHSFEATQNNNDVYVGYNLPTGRKITTKADNLQVRNENKRITYVNPDSAIPAAIFNGAETYGDFTLNPNDFDQIQQIQAMVEGSINGESGDTIVLAPTPYWLTRLELSSGNSDKFETVYNDDIFSEGLGYFVSENQSEKEKNLYNVSSSYGNAPALALTDHFYKIIPIVSFLDTVNGFFYKGMGANGRLRLRFYFPSSIKVSGDATFTLKSIKLVVHDLRLSERRIQTYNKLYSEGISYRTILRNTYEKPLNMSPNNNYDVQLTPFHGPTAALKVCIVPQNRNATNWLTKYKPLNLQVLNENGSRITEILDVDYIKTFVNTENSHPESLYDVNSEEYIIPFCSNLYEAIKTGSMTGLRNLSGKEFIRINAGALNGNYTVLIKQYKYAELNVTNNAPRLLV